MRRTIATIMIAHPAIKTARESLCRVSASDTAPTDMVMNEKASATVYPPIFNLPKSPRWMGVVPEIAPLYSSQGRKSEMKTIAQIASLAIVMASKEDARALISSASRAGVPVLLEVASWA